MKRLAFDLVLETRQVLNSTTSKLRRPRHGVGCSYVVDGFLARPLKLVSPVPRFFYTQL